MDAEHQSTNFRCATCGEEGNFGSSYPTTSCSRIGRRDSACPSCVKIQAVDRQIAETRAFLAHLKAHRATLLRNINKDHDPFLDIIPTELASRIFTFCMEDTVPTAVNNHVPLTLAAVSRRWRAIAQSTAALWTQIRLELNHLHHLPECEDLLRQWLERSAQLPLSIFLHAWFSSCLDDDRWGIVYSVVKILNEHSSRWCHLTLHVPCFIVGQFKSGPEGAHNLRVLSIKPSFLYTTHSDTLKKGFDVGTPLPSPETVTLVGFHLADIKIRWENVTNVSLSTLSIRECFRLFEMAPRLLECTLHYINPNSTLTPNPISPIFLYQLSRLDIDARFTAEDLFDHMVLPSLNSLVYRGCEQPLHPLISCIRRSACPITTLTFNQHYIEDIGTDIYKLLWAVPVSKN
ncbi:unnamed protein product [Cyclocybe aegerita]|uniref:F-box domain-containing protein n=1 Tax=Cyclocybe aegerita TaxID=1973307 RepID=A0A8S0XQD2_CYCAE|nr:unnamed protein product [Cyclocybe aegerita]